MNVALDSGLTAETAAHLPKLNEYDDGVGPQAPEQIEQIDVDRDLLSDLILKLGHTVPNFTTAWMSEQICLGVNVVEELCWQLKQNRLIEVLGQQGPFNYTYSNTQLGCEHAARMMQISGYLGPAPVSLESYAAMLSYQNSRRPAISLEAVQEAISDLVLPENVVEVAALSIASGKSLFLFGPAGNGKTSLGRLLHRVHQGDMWIPYCIHVGQNIIRLFDPQIHQPLDTSQENGRIDRRWIRVQRPFVIAGGEMTIEELDLVYSPSLRYYEAPPHVKANGGTFLIDDFGRQRVDPHDLLNRWIVPLESRTDHLTLHTGQKIQIPFLLMLIVATNLKVSDVADPAFLRRMGYRIHIGYPTPEHYCQIFKSYAARYNLDVPDGLLTELLARYRQEERDLRASEPHDLIERARDICRLRHQPDQLNNDILTTAWLGYFGNTPK